jgi:hypothetical protein
MHVSAGVCMGERDRKCLAFLGLKSKGCLSHYRNTECVIKFILLVDHGLAPCPMPHATVKLFCSDVCFRKPINTKINLQL